MRSASTASPSTAGTARACDQFLVELIWSLARDTLDIAERQTRTRGAKRVAAVVTRFLRDVITNPGMQRWLADEGEHAMRLLTRHETDFQPQLIAAIEALLEAERPRDVWTSPSISTSSPT